MNIFMKTVGLITEYNPFHNGHFYHIEQAKNITGADTVIVVMSGNFVQRGLPAVMSKYARTKAALLAGVSIVIELPIRYAAASAEYFAMGAVSLLEELGCVDFLCFGSESGDIKQLSELAELLLTEPLEYQKYLKEELKKGCSFPLARQRALEFYLKDEKIAHLLDKSNNILAVEYLKALKHLNSAITPVTILRKESTYHETDLQATYSSASAIRNVLQQDTTDFFDLQALQTQLPEIVFDYYKQEYQRTYPVFPEDFSLLMKVRLLAETKESLLTYADITPELANRIVNRLNEYTTFIQFCVLLTTKETTLGRIQRILIHVLLNVRKSDYVNCKNKKFHEYIRVLGFQKNNSAILSHIHHHTALPMITSPVQSRVLSENAQEMFGQDVFASDLYESVLSHKLNTPFVNEYERAVLRC